MTHPDWFPTAELNGANESPWAVLISAKVISRHKLGNIIIDVTSSHHRRAPVVGIYDVYFLSKMFCV
jgi:hypothetical protein